MSSTLSDLTSPTSITFFDFLIPFVTSGKKTITLRDKSESHYKIGSTVVVYPLGGTEAVCDIKILNVEPIKFQNINEWHAQQENMPLPDLLALIRQIYPDTNELFSISFSVVKLYS